VLIVKPVVYFSVKAGLYLTAWLNISQLNSIQFSAVWEIVPNNDGQEYYDPGFRPGVTPGSAVGRASAPPVKLPIPVDASPVFALLPLVPADDDWPAHADSVRVAVDTTSTVRNSGPNVFFARIFILSPPA
jgi:hypothetical protein